MASSSGNATAPVSTGGLVQLARRGLQDIVAIRHDLHAHPELGFEEVRTSALVAAKLAEWGVTDVASLGGTGLVATIRGTRPGDRVVGLRADMDALALTEQNGYSYSSQTPGKMHACGHDGHTSMLLGAARLLAADPDFAGTVRLIFQPAEEGLGGAQKMLDEGLFERYHCDRIFGMHSAPQMEIGEFGTMTGPMMAASGRWTVEFLGAGGHGGAGPHLTQDLTVVAAGYIQALQAVVARNVSAFEPAIISVGHLQAGSPAALNVMPSKLTLGGTMRAFSDEVQALLESRIRELAEAHAAAMGAEAKADLWWNTVPTVTEAAATESAVLAVRQLDADVPIDAEVAPSTGGEDFSFMLQQRPGNFMWLGNGAHSGPGGGQLHTPLYDFSDEALPWGMAYWLSVVNTELDGRLGA